MKPNVWTLHDENRLREHYGRMSLEALAILLDRTPSAVRTRAQRLGISIRQFWTPEQDEQIRRLYPDTDTAELAAMLGRKYGALYDRAARLGVRKSSEYMARHAEISRQRLLVIGPESRFKPGHQTWNKGMKGLQIGGVETRFKKGNRPHTWVPIGTERWRDGYLCRKIRDDGPTHRHFEAVHRLMWIEAHGPIPPGHIVVFLDKNPRNLTLDNLELISRAENARRNHMGHLPPELRQLIGMKSRLTRVINQKQKQLTEANP